jgi:hypothetical protein
MSNPSKKSRKRPKSVPMPRATKKRAPAAEASTDAPVLANITQQLAQTLRLTEPFSIRAEIHGLCVRVATTNAWTKLVHERLTGVLGVDGTRPTLGGVLALIEKLIEQRVPEAQTPAEAMMADVLRATAPAAADRPTVRLGAVAPAGADDPGMHRGPCEDLDGSGACKGCGRWLGDEDDALEAAVARTATLPEPQP